MGIHHMLRILGLGGAKKPHGISDSETKTNSSTETEYQGRAKCTVQTGMNMGAHWKGLRQHDHRDMQQCTVHQHTQDNDADTCAAPGDESAGVGALRSDGVEHRHVCESENQL
jgi:hypothetical protein